MDAEPDPPASETPHKPHLVQARELLFVGLTLIVTAGIVLFVIWHTPLRSQIINLTSSELLKSHAPSKWGGLIAAGSLILSTFFLLPLLATLTGIAVVFGPLWGSCYSFVGLVLGGTLQYALGRLLHKQVLRRISESSLTLFRHKMSKAGPWPIAALRVLPVAPFILINLCAGALRIRASDFILGNAIGCLAPIAAVAFVEYNLEAIAPTANLRGFFVTIVAIATALVVLRKVRQRVRRLKSERTP